MDRALLVCFYYCGFPLLMFCSGLASLAWVGQAWSGFIGFRIILRGRCCCCQSMTITIGFVWALAVGVERWR